MTEYSKGRKIAALVGVTLILATASGGTSVMNAIIPFLLGGMGVDLGTFMLGPTVATILAFIFSGLGIRIIDAISPKWSMLIGTICGAFTMFIVGKFTTFPMWMLANCLNGAVLAFATYAAAGGVVAEFFGKDTQKAFGIAAGLVGLLVAAWQAITGALLGTGMSYQTLFVGYSIAIIIIGFVSNFILIGKVPRRRVGAAKKQETKAEPSKELPGVSFNESLKSGPSIFFFLLAMVLVAWCASGITSYATTYFTSFEMAAATAAIMLSVYSFTAAILKLASGFLIKKLGAKIMAAIIYLGFALGVVLLLIWSKNGVFALAVIGMMLCSFISFSTMIPGLFIPDLYGMKDYTGINSAGMAGYYLGAVVVLFALAHVVEAIGFFNGFVTFVVLAVVCFIFMFLAVGTAPMRKKKESEE